MCVYLFIFYFYSSLYKNKKKDSLIIIHSPSPSSSTLNVRSPYSYCQPGLLNISEFVAGSRECIWGHWRIHREVWDGHT